MSAEGGAYLRNAMSLIGAAVTTVSAVLFLVFFFLDLAGFHTNPYLGIVTFLLLPALFVLGLALMPFGVWWARRRAHRGLPPTDWPVIDLRRVNVRRAALIVAALTCINIAIVAMAATKTIEYADSTGFCTGVCHTPMEPESVAHRGSVHAGISCASCHVGSGPRGFMEAKLGGVRRLSAVITRSYARPIPAPVHDLPVAVGTCGSCHMATRYVGDVPRAFQYFSDDETVTEQVANITLRVGGGGWEAGGPHGIHWHASPTTRVEYIASDDTRATIPWVRVTDHRGEPREYGVEGFTPDATAVTRVMDCTDCHNREGHPIAATIERAVDDALAKNLLPRTLPFVRREAIAVLNTAASDRAVAARQIADHLGAFYAQRQGVGRTADPQVRQAVAATQNLYSANVFPAMNVKWGTYPSQLGHTDAPGCFRCHDETKKTITGVTLSQDCESCHRMQ